LLINLAIDVSLGVLLADFGGTLGGLDLTAEAGDELT
jgi:hypothetical protein